MGCQGQAWRWPRPWGWKLEIRHLPLLSVRLQPRGPLTALCPVALSPSVPSSFLCARTPRVCIQHPAHSPPASWGARLGFCTFQNVTPAL